uniref:Uncharacterized protein n=1 Tax=Ditylum brightwellii TaxID=49249 RepID=A0A6U3QGQ6_9STRA
MKERGQKNAKNEIDLLFLLPVFPTTDIGGAKEKNDPAVCVDDTTCRDFFKKVDPSSAGWLLQSSVLLSENTHLHSNASLQDLSRFPHVAVPVFHCGGHLPLFDDFFTGFLGVQTQRSCVDF